DYGDVLSDRAKPRVRALVRAVVPRAIEHPPEIPIAGAPAPNERRIELRRRRDDARGLCDAITRDDLLPLPRAMVEHQHTNPCHVPCRQKDRIRGVDGPGRVSLLFLEISAKILHLDRPR